MNETFYHLGWWQMALAYVFIGLLLVLVRRRGIPREQEIALATFRMTVQLVLVGYLLEYLFTRPHFALTLAVFVVMEAFAVKNIFARVKLPVSPRLRRVIAVSLLVGTSVSLAYFLLVVVRLDYWYEPRYFIPIAGMIIGNSMTGIAIGAERLISGMRTRAAEVEAALMLGATPSQASHFLVNEAFAAAIMPTINSMMGMGIVFLPGMMTGQILSGTSPVSAIQYQIAIMLGIAGAVSLTVYLMVELGYRSFFNQRSQLVKSDS